MSGWIIQWKNEWNWMQAEQLLGIALWQVQAVLSLFQFSGISRLKRSAISSVINKINIQGQSINFRSYYTPHCISIQWLLSTNMLNFGHINLLIPIRYHQLLVVMNTTFSAKWIKRNYSHCIHVHNPNNKIITDNVAIK